LNIFVNRKLISCDTIVPLALEARRLAPRARISFCVTDGATAEAIRQNRVLGDAINECGRLLDLGRRPGRGRLRHRLAVAPALARLFARTAADRALNFHFKALNKGLLSGLYRLAPGRAYYCQSDSYGFTRLMHDVTYDTIPPPAPIVRPPRATRLIAFTSDWVVSAAPACAHLERFVFGPTRRRRVWLDFVRRRADAYIEEDFARAGVAPTREILAVMLGVFEGLPYLREPDTVRRRLVELLRTLTAQGGGRAIFLKPHVVTDMAILRDALAAVPGGKFVITHLHPMVLAQRARLFACNYYSTTIGDAATLGVPTIEYTDYTDRTLQLTAGGSMRPEFVGHFVNGDPNELERVVRGALSSSPPPPFAGVEGDESGLLRHLERALNGHADR
jgi:hypothetical protein